MFNREVIRMTNKEYKNALKRKLINTTPKQFGIMKNETKKKRKVRVI